MACDRRLLIVEDDPCVAQTLISIFSTDSDVVVAGTYSEYRGLVRACGAGSFDAVLVDMRLPDASGLDIVTELRGSCEGPIIVISGSGDSDRRADVIEMGADDYVMKPFSGREIRARLHRLMDLRRTHTQRSRAGRRTIGSVEFDSAALRLSFGKAEQRLTSVETRILDCLLARRGQVTARRAIHDEAISGQPRADLKIVDVYMSRLRKKLRILDPPSESLLTTIRGEGYLLRALRTA